MRYQKLKDDLVIIEDQPTRYGALWLVIGMINVVGMLVIAIHTLITITTIYPYMQRQFPETLPAVLFTLFAWMGGAFVGVVIIAQGQVIELLLDIRNDIHVTRRYVRRFGYFFARSIEQDKQE